VKPKRPRPIQRPDKLVPGRLYRYCPPPGSPSRQSAMRAVVGHTCMLLRDFGTFVVVTFGGGLSAWITSDYLEDAQ